MREDHPIFSGHSILIVEDEPLIALDVCEALRGAGASVIAGTNVSDALRLIWQAEIAAAVVDIKLGADDCSRVCRALASRDIPFVFYTAYAAAPVLEEWPGVPVIAKPSSTTNIVAAIEKLIARSPRAQIRDLAARVGASTLRAGPDR